MGGEQGEKNGCSGQCLSKHRELWDGGDATFAHIKHGHMVVVKMMMMMMMMMMMTTTVQLTAVLHIGQRE